MAKDIVQEAVEQAEAMKEAAYENAKSVLVNAMSTNLKAAVSEAIGDKINEDGNPKGANLNVNYDPEGLKNPEGDDLTDEGDGPAIIEAGVDEGDDFGGGKGDESKSRRDYEDEDDEDENEGDEYGGDKGDESRSDRDYEAALEDEDEDEDDEVDVDIDIDDDDDEDIDEVLEIIEDEDEDDEDVDVDVDVDEDEDVEERGMLNKKVEATVKENRQLRRENRRYEKALTFLKKRIDEVNLFNARLAAASDMMRKVTLTKDEKQRVVEHFDRARNVGEVKRTYRALVEGYRASSRGVKKQRIARPNVQSVLTEDQKKQNTNQSQFDRMSELAGL
jgi:hypothetical protein